MYLHYYVYAYLRTDGTPYYIGKGKDSRAYAKHAVQVPKDRSRIIFLEKNLTEIGSLAIERRLIRWYGRKSDGSGILRNIGDGGEGSSHSNGPMSKQTKQRISKARKGGTSWNKGIPHLKGIPKSDSMRKKMSALKLGNPSKSSHWKIINTVTKHETIEYNLKLFCLNNNICYNKLYYYIKNKDGVVPSLSLQFIKL